jgi:hypothetical protein
MEYKFQVDDSERIRKIHGQPPMFVFRTFKCRYNREVKITESVNGFDGYWLKLSIKDHKVQSIFERTVLNCAFNWDQRYLRLKHIEKSKMLAEIEKRFKFKTQIMFSTNYTDQDAATIYNRWVDTFGKPALNRRWYIYKNFVFFRKEQDLLLFKLIKPC